MKKAILFSTILLLSITITAQEDQEALPGNTSLPSTKEELKKLADFEKTKYNYSVVDYFERPKQSTFRFSPNGEYLSFRQKDDDGKRHVMVKNVKTGKIEKAIEEKIDLIRGYGWANDNRLIYVMDKGGDENYHLYAVDLDGKNNKDLTPFDGVRVEIIENLKEHKEHMIIEMNKNNPEIFEPYKVNITTGEIEQLYKNTDVENPISGYDFDKNGILKAYSQKVNGTDYALYYRLSESDPFEKIMQTSWKDDFYDYGI